MAGCPTPSVLWRFERATSVLKNAVLTRSGIVKTEEEFYLGNKPFGVLQASEEAMKQKYKLWRRGGIQSLTSTRGRWEMCCSRETIFSQVTHIYPISELGQNNVDYWTHLMLKTNTSYFTGSSQLNNRFFFHSCNTLRNIHSHGCIQTIFLSFWFFFQ